MWHDYFSKNHPKPADVRRFVLKLHNDKRYEHVITAIEGAILHGQSQPWMYDVLALTMEIAGRPREEIERVLLSRVDVTGLDIPNMLMSAAYLTRFGGEEPALRLYRQVSRLAPTRPEPYILGLKLARSRNDVDAVEWAATGILTSAWTKNHHELHRQAENAAAEEIQRLESEGRIERAKAFRRAMQNARRRDLVLRLTWSGTGDLDLVVEEPGGLVCSCQNPQSPAGGVLVHDGYGPDQKNCYEEYVAARAMPGTYRVRIRHIWGNIVGKRARLTVIRDRNSPEESIRSFTVPLAETDRIVRLALPQGRRRKAAPVESKETAQAFQQPRRPADVLRQIGLPGGGGQGALQNFAVSRRAVGAVGFQPVVANFTEGISLPAAAVVSGDRRYVRIGLSPRFSNLTDLFTFSFVNTGGNPTGNPGLGGAQGNAGP